jgi:peptidoglycan/LPS O-acetylase OafA/YrhL
MSNDSESQRPMETNLGCPSHSSSGGFHIEYRGDIEGLRAVAILLVVAAHAGVSWLEGGYVGVDVFFVLSGYLISAILLQEARATGGVRLVNFYARRLRRLLPALMVTLLGTIGMAAALLAPFEQMEQTAAAGAASVWLSNLFFAFSKLDYFGPAADTNLFLHTWSLGVEEQFYVFWPAWLIFLLGMWRWQGRMQNFRRLRCGMAATCCVCLAFSIGLTYTQPSWAFYLMPFRAWQFALGALILLASKEGGWGSHPSASGAGGSNPLGRFSVPVGWAGLIVILLSAVGLNTRTPYPGAWALLPSLGAAAVLFAGEFPLKGGVGRFLSLPPFQKVGHVSYAWYLWHWPILLLGASVIPSAGPIGRAVLVAVSLTIAVVSNRFIETPLRRSSKLSGRPRFVLAASLTLMIGAAALSFGWMQAASLWMMQPEQQRFRAARSDVPAVYPMGCDDWYLSPQVKVCGFGPEDAEHTAVIIGDSIALQWFPAFRPIYTRPGWRLLVMTKSSCPMVDESFFYSRIGAEYTVCNAWRDAALDALQHLKPDVVVLGSAVSYPFGQEQWEAGTARVLGIVAATARNVFVLRATHPLPFDGPNCLSRKDWRRQFLPSAEECTASVGSPRESQVHGWIERAAANYQNVQMLDLNPLICPNGRCEAERDGQVIFRDSQHLSASYVESLADKLASQILAVGSPPPPDSYENPIALASPPSRPPN